jgi:predicted nuclease of predicted toxin-antitoxin system
MPSVRCLAVQISKHTPGCMKFLVDEQLPGSLVAWLSQEGHDAVHATSLGTEVKISDVDISQESMKQKRIVISKDVDFFNRFLIKKEPWKLLYLTTGNISNRDLLSLFQSNLHQILQLFQNADVVEMNRQNLLIRL